MKKLITRFLASFDTHTNGFSGRKLTAFWVIGLATYLHRFANSENAIEFLIVDYCVCMICLGLVTSEQVIRLREGKTVTEKRTVDVTENSSEVESTKTTTLQ